MSIAIINGIKIGGLAVSVPKSTQSNFDYPFATEKERQLFVRTVGIETRRVAPVGLTASDLCVESAEKLLIEKRIDRKEIKALIFISQTPDYLIPPTATILQDKLGLPKDCIALDINLGCSGYVYGLFVISSLMKTLNVSKGLLLVGDVSTSRISPTDKSTAPIFSDAGSATILEQANKNERMYFNLANDGSGFETIAIPDGGMRNPINDNSRELITEEEGITRNRMNLRMKGVEVFNFSLREVVPNIKQLLEQLKLSVADVDYFLFHQANLLMNEAIRKKLDIVKEKVPYSLKDFGNTSCATIPVTMITQLRAQLQNENLKLLLSGFGVGLSWGSVVLNTNKITCLPLLEI